MLVVPECFVPLFVLTTVALSLSLSSVAKVVYFMWM
jgi:hypothetical protein